MFGARCALKMRCAGCACQRFEVLLLRTCSSTISALNAWLRAKNKPISSRFCVVRWLRHRAALPSVSMCYHGVLMKVCDRHSYSWLFPRYRGDACYCAVCYVTVGWPGSGQLCVIHQWVAWVCMYSACKESRYLLVG